MPMREGFDAAFGIHKLTFYILRSVINFKIGILFEEVLNYLHILFLFRWACACLLYTSDAADERSSVDLGGRRIIKKKNRENNSQIEVVLLDNREGE